MKWPVTWPVKWPVKWLDLPRVPEPEAMDDSDEVEAYSSAAAQAYLGKIDDTLVNHAVRLAAGFASNSTDPRNTSAKITRRLLDVGTGPGQITLKLAQRLPGWELTGWHLTGIDRSPNMIRQAVTAAQVQSSSMEQGNTTAARVEFLVGDANRLPFADASFDLVLCNSVLHHLANPASLLAEIGRVAKPHAAILVRDLRRPSRIAYPFHVRWHGRHYSGLMYKLFCDSVRSAYTAEELAGMLRTAALPGVRIFTHGRTHVGFERAISDL
jgi:ubiquinone/menaquinone biosynthesis C-methylase UbiE